MSHLLQVPPAADPALAAWLSAPNGAEADRALVDLIERVATPVIRQALGRKLGGAFGSDDAQEAISRVREQLVRSARRMREAGAAPVRDFAGYVATVAYNVWAECLRDKYPARTLLSHRLRYLLENRTGQTGFALWTDPAGDSICGFAVWRAKKTSSARAEAVRQMLVDPAREDASADLAATVARILRQLGGPAPFADLLTIVAERTGASEAPVSLDADPESHGGLIDPAASPEDTLRWREYLGWLWQEIGSLPLRQRRAFLLHSTAAHELEHGAIADMREQAAALDLPTDLFAGYWARLPLDDLTIAALLGVTRQQVINLRKVARLTLGESWRRWLHRAAPQKVFGHNGRVSASI